MTDRPPHARTDLNWRRGALIGAFQDDVEGGRTVRVRDRVVLVGEDGTEVPGVVCSAARDAFWVRPDNRSLASGHAPEPTMRSASPAGLYTTAELMERCGASFRQVDYWSRMGYISPVNSQSGPGYKRLYDEHAFEMACRFSSFMLLRQREVREVAELLSQPDPVLEDGWLVMRSEDGAVEVRFRPVLDSHTPNEVTAP